jgi:hypothetical protein
MRLAKSTRPDPAPDFVFKQSAGDRNLLPERCRRPAFLDQQVREDY